MITREEVIKASGLHPSRILNIYLFGSRVYRNSNLDSDWDIIIIANTSYPEKEIISDKFNIHIMTVDRFSDGLDYHNIRNIECVLAPAWAKLQELHLFNLDIKLNKLRHSISHSNSNSWVKCKKKLSQGDYYIGIKSIWHSMRIAMFGTQLATYGNITDWECANDIWAELNSKKWSWEELDQRFRKFNNGILSEFRLKAPSSK
jgi:hypothetical protein